MKNEEIIEYIQKQKSITVPSLQTQFSITYRQAKVIVDKMIEDEELVYDSGVTYNVCAKKTKEKSGSPLISETETESPFARFMRLRRESAESSNQTDDDEDEEEDTNSEHSDAEDYDEIVESLEEDANKDKDGRESIRSARYSLSHYFEIMKLKRIISENLGDVIQQKYIDGEQCCVFDLGEDRCFKLSFVNDENYIKISDFGKTVSEGSENWRKALEIIHEYTNIEYAYGEISVTLHRNGDVLTAMLEMFAATERIKHIQ